MLSQRKVIVVDDFYVQPDQVREFALRQPWLQADALPDQFAGTESKRCFYSRALIRRFAQAVGSPIRVDPVRNSFGAFALTTASDEKNKVVHVDGCQWTGIVYLTPDDQCQGGTSLYRHRRTGFNRVPTEEEAQKFGLGSQVDFVRRVVEDEGRDETAWELDVKVGMRFNRLLLFRGGERFHSADSYFGDGVADGRLVQLFFFEERAL